MKNNAVRWSVIAVCAFAAFGCASVGGFNYPGPTALQLGQTRSSDYKAMFGEPLSVETTEDPDGDFEVSLYKFGYIFGGAVYTKRLVLESRNGVLNAYRYFSTFSEDKTDMPALQPGQIQRGVSTKADVLKVLGMPHGKAFCPSTLPIFRHVCVSGGESWVWTTAEPRLLGSRLKGSSVVVGFDTQGIVTKVESFEENNNR